MSLIIGRVWGTRRAEEPTPRRNEVGEPMALQGLSFTDLLTAQSEIIQFKKITQKSKRTKDGVTVDRFKPLAPFWNQLK